MVRMAYHASLSSPWKYDSVHSAVLLPARSGQDHPHRHAKLHQAHKQIISMITLMPDAMSLPESQMKTCGTVPPIRQVWGCAQDSKVTRQEINLDEIFMGSNLVSLPDYRALWFPRGNWLGRCPPTGDRKSNSLPSPLLLELEGPAGARRTCALFACPPERPTNQKRQSHAEA